MTEIKRVKIQNFVDTQIPEFLNSESPLFKEFLTQYYISQEYQTGIVDLANNLPDYKSIDIFNNETFFTNVVPCALTADTKALDDIISVNHTIGFPETYGLLKIDDEIITYTGKTSNSFTGCVRGFSGIDELSKDSLRFTTTEATSHTNNSTVQNLTGLFFNKLFEKFKNQFLPGFENRNFDPGVSIKNILSRAKDFYASKGTDVSYKILFKVLYNNNIEVIKPLDYTIKTSDGNYIKTKSILLEKISGGDPVDIIGKTLFQGETSSASVYNVEIRPVEGKFLYEVSLDDASITVPFNVTNKTNIIKEVSSGEATITVDSTIGFPNSGKAVIISPLYTEPVEISYQEKNFTQFFAVSGIDFDFFVNDELVEDNFAFSFLDDGSTIKFRVVSVIGDFDFSETSNLRTGDKILISNFGKDLGEYPNFYSWKYNVPVISDIESITGPSGSNKNIWNVNLYDKIKFYPGETVLISDSNDPDNIKLEALVLDTFEDVNRIQIQIDSNILGKNTVEKIISYSNSNQNYFSGITSSTSCIQNTYTDSNNDYFYVASTGLPDYEIFARDRKINVFTDVGSEKTTVLNTEGIHRFYTGEKVFYFSSPESNSGISSGIYYINLIGQVSDSTSVNLAYSKSDLFNGKFLEFNQIGFAGEYFVKLDYENKTLENQKLFKKFNFNKKESVFEKKGDRDTNNRTIGMLCNGVELYSPSLYDENLYYGKLDSISVIDSGDGYDVINDTQLTIEDEIGSGASVNLNLTGSLKGVKVVRPGIGYELKPKISLIGGNGSGAVIKPNLAKTRITSSFRGDGFGVNTALNIITFNESHNFNDCEEVLYDSNGNANISYEEEVSPGIFVFPKLSNNASYFAGVLNSTQIKLYRTKNDCVEKINPIQFRNLTSGIHNLKTLNSKNTISQIYIENPGSGYSNKKVTVQSILSADNTINGINTFDDYVFAKNHNFKNKDLVKYSYQTSPISGLSTTTLYSVTVLDENKFKLSETGYEEESTNLILYSQNTDNGNYWVRDAIDVIQTDAEIAPDGTRTADLVIIDTDTTAHGLRTVSSIFEVDGVYTLSVFAKKYGAYKFLQFAGAGILANNEGVVFDLDLGEVNAPSLSDTYRGSKIENYGNGWYRCSLTVKSTLSNEFYIRINENINYSGDSYTGDGVSGLYIWGAQVERGENISSYIPTFDDNVTRSKIEANYNDYNNKTYVSLNSLGSGYQSFAYPPIQLRIEVQSGITSSIEVEPILEPIVTGNVDSVFIVDSGEKYGTPEIINFHRRPNAFIGQLPSIPQVKPVVIDGKIIDVQILSQGSGLTKGIDILISGDGSYGDLYPVIENGKLIEVKVLNQGIGYDPNTTKLTVVKRGVGAKFIVDVTEWKINQVYKNGDLINYDFNKDEGIIVPSKNSKFGLQIVNFYPPKKLRNQLNDNINLTNNREKTSNLNHSPIIGWAYDGNPIYGPYGQIGSQIRRVNTSYFLDVETNTSFRPNYPFGFFIQDYKFDRAFGDLDEYNGRYCKTPDFPEGVYAYFYTIDDSPLSNPVYPYITGFEVKDNLIPENYNLNFNQEFNISNLEIIRNNSPYYVTSDKTRSIFLNTIDPKYQQEFSVDQVISSSIEKLSIISPGRNYKVGDNVIFDNFNTFGSGLSASISEIRGKDLNTIGITSTVFSEVSFFDKLNTVVGITSVPHNLFSNDTIIINGVGDSKYSDLEGPQKVFVNQKSVGLVQDIPDISTGFSTSIVVNDIQGFEVDSLIQVDSEIMRITNIIPEQYSFYVDRISGYSTHSAGISSIVLLPNKFTITKDGVDYGIKENRKVFFDPTNYIGFGGYEVLPFTQPSNPLLTQEMYDNIVNNASIFDIDGDGYITETDANFIAKQVVSLPPEEWYQGIDIRPGATRRTGYEVYNHFQENLDVLDVTRNGTISSFDISLLLNFVQEADNSTVFVGEVNTGISYTDFKNSSIFVPEKSIFIEDHNFYTGQELIYNIGPYGNGLLVSDSSESNAFRLVDGQKVYAINYGPNYLGISTVGFTTSSGIGTVTRSLYFYDTGTTGKTDSFKTNYENITAQVENYSITANTSEEHNLQTNDLVSLSLTPDFVDTYSLTYDIILRKIVTNIVSFASSSVIDLSTSEVKIEDNLLETGQKVVYYSNGNDDISELINNNTYYIIKTSFNKVRFAKTYSDSLNGTYVPIYNASTGIHKIGYINPPIKINEGNILKFDLSDPSLTQMDLKLYKDVNFVKELEDYRYTKSVELPGFADSFVTINTNGIEDINEFYYNLIPNSPLVPEKNQISSDIDVKGRNKVLILPPNLNREYSIVSTGSTTFKINLVDKPERVDYTISSGISTIFYSTKSLSASGPIEKLKVNFEGKGYKKVPRLLRIDSENGTGASIKPLSSTVGKIDSFVRVKDGYDYPTDPTLRPYLNVPTVSYVRGISRIESVGIVTGGTNYNSAPYLTVVGNPDIELSCKIQGGSVTEVRIDKNVNNLDSPLEIIPTKNTNGYDIDNITVSGNYVTLELVNSDTQLFPLIATSYGGQEIKFPFEVGDEIFIENCRISLTETDKSGNLIPKDNYNSSDYNYKFFKVVGVSTDFFTVTYDISDYQVDLGEYTFDFGYGYVTNRKVMAKFEMNLIDDLNYFSNERVLGYNSSGTNTFSAEVMDGGWDGSINELRLKNSKGVLKVGDRLFGEKSKLNGIVDATNTFNVLSRLSPVRDKIEDSLDKSGLLSDYQQRISDNDYYQKFSYAIQSEIPYSTWKEPIRSVIHPAGFKEFSDLNVISKSSMNMLGLESVSSFIVNIDSDSSMYRRNNFTIVSEDPENQFEDGSIERIDIGAELAYVSGIGITGPVSGVPLQPYILNNTNKVVRIDDISDQFNGSSNYTVVGVLTATFSSYNRKYLGISTSGLQVGDYVGFSEYLIPDLTYITSIGINSVGINIPHNVLQGDSETEILIDDSVRITRTIDSSEIIGITSFKLTENNTPLFYREFDSSDSSIVNLVDNQFNIENHNFQVGQKVTYFSQYGSSIGIGTTSAVENSIPVIVSSGNTSFLSVQSSDSSIITSISGGIGSALYENGYNVAISGPIVGTSASVVPNFTGLQNNYFGYPYGYPQKSSSGIGTGAKFSAFIVYNSTTGQPISTSVVLNSGGSGYQIGDTVSISGTYFGGVDTVNDLSFTVTKVSSTIIPSESNNSYLNLGSVNSGSGSGAVFNVYRDPFGGLENVQIVDGGVGYALTDRITIVGSDVGGTNGVDDIFISPTGLGTDKLPSTLYVNFANDDTFSVSGLAADNELDLNSLGIGTQAFEFDNANASTLLVLDNIIQSPLYIRDVKVTLASPIGLGTDVIYLNAGISSITSIDILKIDDEYFEIKNIGIGSTNSVTVGRAFLGSVEQSHNSNAEVILHRGNYNIVKDTVYFATPPYGDIGPEGLQVNSQFQGRFFSRKFDPGLPNDKNIILDDISQFFTGSDISVGIITGTFDSTTRNIISGINTTGLALGDVLNQINVEDRFIADNTRIFRIGNSEIEIVPNHNVSTGIATTAINVTRLSYVLKSNKQNVVGLYTNTNSSVSINASGNINNNPIILINNIPQVSGTDYIIDTENQNTFKFISGIPNAGKIVRVDINSAFGYQPLVGASATVTVSNTGNISNITLTGYGSGYRSAPVISLISNTGTGATFSSTIGSGGTITSVSIDNPGIGYTSNPLPLVSIDLPFSYSDLDLEYIGGTSGDGEGAKVSVVVGSGSSIVGFELEDAGSGYKVGDQLSVVGIVTDPNAGPTFDPFVINVEEIFTDKFSGFYPGQFLQFDSIAPFFNGIKKKFTVTITENGIPQAVNLKIAPGNTLNIENNLFVYINDVLQEPLVSYTFLNSRIIFKEAPLKGSKCTVLFYKGSDLDVEQIDPPKTIKSGDKVIIEESILDPTDRRQFERVVKLIVSSDSFDTFTYNSIGINTDTTKSRPLTWIKQTQDRVINGVLQSKSRPDLKSRVTPSCQLIRSIGSLDRFFYVDNAFPMFSAVDRLSEELSNINIVQNREISPAIGTAIVSAGSTISAISVNNNGAGYLETLNPIVSISSAFIKKKDPIYNWQKPLTGTLDDFYSITYGDNLVSVGQSGVVGFSTNGIDWSPSSIGYGSTISFNSVVAISTNKYIAVGENSKIVYTVSSGSSLSSWSEYPLSILVRDISGGVEGESVKEDSDYSNTFNSVVYSPVQDKVVAVGNSSGAFLSVGIGSDLFLEQNSNSFDDLLSVSNNDLVNGQLNSLSNSRFVAVGKDGAITISTNGENWVLTDSKTTNQLNSVVWDGVKFVVVGNNSTILTSGLDWNWIQISNNLPILDISKIVYYEDFYVISTSDEKIYYSFDLNYWLERSTNQNSKINDLIFVDSLGLEGRYIGVGSTGTAIYAEPIYNRATAVANVAGGVVTTVDIIDPGFGYSKSEPPPVIFESDTLKSEEIISYKVEGDFGNIVNVSVGSTTIDFELKTEYYDGPSIGAGIGYSSLNRYGVFYSQLERGDYFTIFDSSPTVGHALTCIDLDNGGLSNYPDSIVGTATTYLDGVYKVAEVIGNPTVISGITTVRCYFALSPSGGAIQVNTFGVTNQIYGKYSWSRFYDYENRATRNSKPFQVNTNNGLTGLTTSPIIYRTRGLI